MLNFIKNFFRKKELWIFASYIGVGINEGLTFGHLCKPYYKINKYNELIKDIIAYGEEQGCKKGSVVILYFKIFEQYKNKVHSDVKNK